MKKLILSAAIIAATTFGCQHDGVESVTDSSVLAKLSTEELQVASSIGRLGSSSEVLAQALAYQKVNPANTSSVTINRSTLESILTQSHTVGIRAYYVKTGTGKLDLALVGIDKNLDNRYITNAMFSGGKSTSEESFKQQMASFQAENPTAIRAVAFGSKVIADVLSQNNCTGIKFYFTIDKDGNHNLALIGINSQQKELYGNSPNARSTEDGDAGTNGMPCPQHCGK